MRTASGIWLPHPHQTWPQVGSRWPAWNVESDQARGLVAWWPVLGTQTATIPGLLGGTNGTLVNGATIISDAQRGSCININAVTEYVDFGNASAFTDLPASGDCTVALWQYYTSVQTAVTRLVFTKWGSGAGWRIQARPIGGGPWRVYFGAEFSTTDLDYNTDQAVSPLPLNQWNLITCIYHSADHSAQIYINGEETAYTTQTDGVGTYQSDSAQNLYVSNGANAPLGKYSGMRIYNRALTDAQVAELYDRKTRWELYQIPRNVWAVRWAVAPGQTGTFTIDAAIEAAQTGTVTLDATIKRARTGTLTSDAVILRARTGTLTSDAAIKAAQTGTVTGDAVIQSAQTGTATLDAVILRARTGTATLDAAIKAAQTGTATLDAVILRARTGTLTGDGVIQSAQTGTLTSDAVILRARTGTATGDAIIQVARTGTVTADALIAGAFGTFTIDAIIYVAQTGTLTSDAIIQVTETDTLTLDAVVYGAVTSKASVIRTTPSLVPSIGRAMKI